MRSLIIMMVVTGQCLYAQWTMFSDGTDTYLYNTQTGDVYVRYKKGKKNYEDVFIKMPAGILQQKDPTQTLPKSANQNLEAIQKSQELLRQSIDSGALLE